VLQGSGRTQAREHPKDSEIAASFRSVIESFAQRGCNDKSPHFQAVSIPQHVRLDDRQPRLDRVTTVDVSGSLNITGSLKATRSPYTTCSVNKIGSPALSVNVIENIFDEIGRGSINGIGYVNVIGSLDDIGNVAT
jgi:hypothetical protein